jgi:CRISPR type I-E-associated protein CasA/Cse1
MNSYNLLSEGWIPVLYRNGDFRRVGILKALKDAHRIRQIAASNPMDRVAILRFLLALLYWCKGNPPEDREPALDGPFPTEWLSKLEENKECFNLLGQGKRFYQDCQAQRSRGVLDLLQEIPTGNNFWHFRHSTDGVNGLCTACCAMGLLRLPLFSLSGLPNLKSGINGTPPVYAVPWGVSLLDTLGLNWVQCSELGIPAWIQPDIRATPDHAVPLLVGLTLLSRRVWLHEPGDEAGVCIGCGESGSAVIRTCEFETAGDQENDLWDDPHVVYSTTTPRKASRASDLTAAQTFRMDRPMTDLIATYIEAGKTPAQKAVHILFVGFATDKAKNVDVWERTVTVPPTCVQETGSSAHILQWQKAGKDVEKRLERLVRSAKQSKAAMAGFRPQIEHDVSADIVGLHSGGDAAWEQAAAAYAPVMETIAGAVSAGYTTQATRLRRGIGRVKPEVTHETTKKARGKGKEK